MNPETKSEMLRSRSKRPSPPAISRISNTSRNAACALGDFHLNAIQQVAKRLGSWRRDSFLVPGRGPRETFYRPVQPAATAEGRIHFSITGVLRKMRGIDLQRRWIWNSRIPRLPGLPAVRRTQDQVLENLGGGSVHLGPHVAEVKVAIGSIVVPDRPAFCADILLPRILPGLAAVGGFQDAVIIHGQDSALRGKLKPRER